MNNRNVCLELRGGAASGGDTSPPSLEEPVARSLFPVPFPAVPCLPQRSPRPREAAGFVRSRTAGEAKFPVSGRRGHGHARRGPSPAPDPHPSNPLSKHRQPRVFTRIHSCFRAQLPLPGPACLLGARSASPAGPRGSSVASLRLRSPPLLLPALFGAAAAPPTSPRARRLGVRGAPSRCGRALCMPLPGGRW